MSTTHRPARGLWFAASLALASVLGPAGTDMYLSSLPDIGAEFGAGPSTVQLTLTVYLLAMGAGQLLFGPIIDALGRRGPLLAGIGSFIASSVWAAASTGIGSLLAARFVQGLGAALSLVIVLSMVRDVARGAKAAQLFALLMTIEGLAPVLAPSAGGIIDSLFGWRAVLLVLAGLGLIAFVNSLFSLPETLAPADRTSLKPGRILATYVRIGSDRRFLLPTLALSAVFFFLFGYIGGAPFIYRERFGLDAESFGLVFGATGIAVVFGAILSGRTVARFGAARLAVAGVGFIVAGAAIALVAGTAGAGLPGVAAGMFVSLFGLGISEATLMALVMSSQTVALGSTAALLGAFQLCISSLATPAAGVFGARGTTHWLAFLLAAALLSLGLVLWSAVAFRDAPVDPVPVG